MGIKQLFVGEDTKLLQRIAVALERIADHLEGKTQLQALPPEPIDPHEFQTVSGNHEDLAHIAEVEEALCAQLGRDPTPEEILTLVDGVEWDEQDAKARHAYILERTKYWDRP